MRILMNEYEILEVVDVDVTPCYRSGADRPTDLFISILAAYDLPLNGDYDEKAFKGEYLLDGTEETLNAALANWSKVRKKLLEKGFCSLDDFENVEWY